jgi:protocatechuate 3,4-dioxygenase beta subunit
MTSSGMKRGLAATAVSALALTGVPFMASTAHANELADQAGAGNVVLYTPEDAGFASVKNDGVNTTVHLLASGGADVIQVQFQWSNPTVAGGAWQNIGTPVSRSNGAFSTEWTPPTGIYNLPTTTVRASALNNVNVEIATDDATAVTASSGAESIDIGNASGSSIGVYIDEDGSELGAVSGTTSDVAADPALTFNSPSGSGGNTTEDVKGTPSGGVRSYSAPVDFAGYPWETGTGAVNEAVVYAEAQGSDAEAVTLYKQTISSVTAVAEPVSPQSGGNSVVTVTVLDQNGKPVVGANVHQEGGAEKETNSQGKAEFTVTDSNPNGGTTFTYFVDEDNDNTWDSGVEFRRTVTVADYTPTATSITSNSHDGDAFDLSEYTADNGQGEGDITITVKDQNGAALKGQTLTGRWTITPFDGSDATTVAATITDADNDGVYNVALPGGGIEGSYKLNAWIEKDGTPGESAGDMSMAPLTFEAGQAEIVWDDEAVAQRAAGTTAVFEATMELDNGTGLPGRNVAITWDANDAGNAVVAAQGAQPANTTRTSNTTASSKTDADGSFGVAISDPAATPNVNELDGSLDAEGVQTDPIGDSDAQADALNVDFLADLKVSSDLGDTNTAHEDLTGNATPGRPSEVTIVVKNAEGTLLTDLPVKVSTDHGFFTTPDADSLDELEPAPAAAEGKKYGYWENLGTEVTTETNDDGYAEVVVAIERDAGFDDDGVVDAKVTFEVGGKTFTETVRFNSEDPLNPGELTIDFSEDDEQTVGVLPKAPTSESVYLDVFATDQFGNLTEVYVDLEDDANNGDADWYTDYDGWNGDTWSQFENEDPAIEAEGYDTVDQTISGTWEAETNTWTDGDTVKAGFQEEDGTLDGEFGYDSVKHGEVDVTDDAPTIEWYEIDYAKSSYSLQQEGPENNAVGTTVTEVYKAKDQHGEPIEDIIVRFFRTGPDAQGDGDGNSTSVTGDDGEAYYTFQGAQTGTATVTAVPYHWTYDDEDEEFFIGERIPEGERSDTVQFGGSVGPKSITALLELVNQKDGDDVAKVNAPKAAAGAKVQLFKVRKDGSRKLIAEKTANAKGNAKFAVNDSNGKKHTTYKAKVYRTADTFADWTPKKRIR